VQNGQILTQLMQDPFKYISAKVKKDLFSSTFQFWPNFKPFCLDIEQNLLLCMNIEI
jgi:hypothetical protein